MKFPWPKYEEIELPRRNTLQIFITNKCNYKCEGCFARNVMSENGKDITLEEYKKAIKTGLEKGVQQINLLGGEPLMHPDIKEIIKINITNNLKTTIYTNGFYLNKFTKEDLEGVKIRISFYTTDKHKGAKNLEKTDIPFDANFMVSKNTTVEDLLDCARYVEEKFNCPVFFIFSMRELDNERQEFFDDTKNTMPVIKYKELVHNFLEKYEGNMEIHISKRGVFESTKTLPDNKCHFANYFIGGKVIQCPYDVVNLKFQEDYEFNCRFCQQNNTCLMSKIKLKRK